MNYRYLEFISSFDDHSSGRKKLDDISHSQKEKDRSYRGFNFFDSRNLSVLEAISSGEYMTFGMQGKNLITALGKEIIAAGLTVKNLILVPSLASLFCYS